MNFKYEIEEYENVESNALIALDPEKRVIYSHGSGNSTPACIWNNFHINILRPPHRFVKDSLIKFLNSKEVQEILSKIMISYKGCDWNGSNHVGKWNSDDDCCTDFEYLCHDLEVLLYDKSVECYWDIEEFCEDVKATKELIAHCKTIEESAEYLVDCASDNNISINLNNVISWLEENIKGE